MSPTGETRDAGWQIGASRTLDHPVDVVWDLLTSPRGLALWLGSGAAPGPERGTPWSTAGGIAGETRGWRRHERIRLTHAEPGADHETTVQVALREADAGRTRVTFHQERMLDAGERERRRAYWHGVLDALEAALG